jgi:succinoglycan biosynthesis transport protein ExoP
MAHENGSSMNGDGHQAARYPVEWPGHSGIGLTPFRPMDIEIPGRGATSNASAQGFSDYWTIFVTHKWLVLFCAMVGAGGGWLFAAFTKPVYQARTLLEIRGLNENFMNAREVDPTAGYTWEPSYLQTQIRILQTGALGERAAAVLRARQQSTVKTYAPPSWWRVKLGFEAGTTLADALAMARRTTHVRPLGTARFVEITSDSTDPKIAADFANMLVHEFIEQSVELRGDTTQSTQEWLSTQLADLKGKLEKSEEELQAYARDAGMLLTDEHGGGADQAKLRSTQDELSRAEADRITKDAHYETALGSTAESLPLELDDGSVRDNVAKLGDLRRQYAEVSSTLTPEHYKVKRIAAQITEVEENLRAGWKRIVARLEKSYQGAVRRQEYLEKAYGQQYKQVATQAAKSVNYNILKREVETNRQMYENTLQKVRGASIAAALRASNLRVVEPAKIPLSPHSPNPTRNTGMGLAAGLLMGMLAAALRVRTDHSLREPGEARSYLRVPELGVIPSEAYDHEPEGRLGFTTFTTLRLPGKRDRSESSVAGFRECVELATLQRRPSFVAESFRATLASILFSGDAGLSPRVLVVASPDPAEGKTTMVSNLGLALAEIDRRVVLIDGDMRKPSLHRIFDLANTWGLSDLLSERTPLADSPMEALVKRTSVSNLHVLPAGPATPNISTLLYSPRLPELLQRFRREFDFVLIDTAPMLMVSDARLFAKSADAVVLVFRSGSTTRQSAQDAVERLSADGSALFGAILNDWSPAHGKRWYKNRYHYRYQRAAAE